MPTGRTVLLANPRGFCAGVRRAVDMAESLLRLRTPPVYGLHEIVHNRQVVERLQAQGLVVVNTVSEAPEGATLLLSAHGVPPVVRIESAARRLEVIDATCPFVTKVHAEVKRYAAQGFSVALIGHRGHDEVVGVAGEAPDRVTVIESEPEAEAFQPADPERVAVVTQTTLSQAETDRVLEALRRRFPNLRTPPQPDICFATVHRQEAVRRLAQRVARILVLGSANSSNSRRLAEVAAASGAAAHLVSRLEALDALPLNEACIGLTAGASTPESFLAESLARLRERGFTRVEELPAAHDEIRFELPPALRPHAPCPPAGQTAPTRGPECPGRRQSPGRNS